MAPDDPFGCELPTEAQAVAALGEVVGDDMAEGLWSLSTRALGIARPVSSATDMRRVADSLTEVSELAGVTARSLRVRVLTHVARAGAGGTL